MADFLSFEDATAWESWLREHHDQASGVWLKIAKNRTGIALVNITEALDVALCYGWIDSHRKAFDEQSFLQRYTPRRPRSSWSKINVDKVQALVAAGRMRPAGLEQVRAARADGRWDAAHESRRTAGVPPGGGRLSGSGRMRDPT